MTVRRTMLIAFALPIAAALAACGGGIQLNSSSGASQTSTTESTSSSSQATSTNAEGRLVDAQGNVLARKVPIPTGLKLGITPDQTRHFFGEPSYDSGTSAEPYEKVQYMRDNDFAHSWQACFNEGRLIWARQEDGPGGWQIGSGPNACGEY